MLNFVNLDDVTRKFMLEEIESDVAQNTLYYSPRLSATGKQLYPDMLRRAARKGTNLTFAGELRLPGRLNKTEERKAKGGTAIVQVPITAAETIAASEFNRYYARALCRRAQAQGIEALIVYRANEVVGARPESAALIGKSLPVNPLLEALRANPDVEMAFGLPPGPNTGLSVKLPSFTLFHQAST